MDFQFARVDGLSVRYVDTRTGSRTILLVHGLGGSIESWINNISGLSKELRVVALDLPGFGYSDKPKMDYTIKFYSDFVSRFAQTMGIAPAAIVGSSLGGHVGAEVAIRHPGAVSRLVMISPPGALPKSFTGTPALKKYVKVLQARSVPEVKKALFAVNNRPVDDNYAKIVYEKLAMPGAKEAFLSALMGSARAPRLNGRLGRIKAPAMLLWGKDDTMIPPKYAEPFIRMKNCRVVLLEGCGHRVHVDKPQVFNRLVTGFVQEEG
jgi:2-hydroxy-6-oxonona-2,4-dienedioate hydrolase